jgi:hypothetical protein
MAKITGELSGAMRRRVWIPAFAGMAVFLWEPAVQV